MTLLIGANLKEYAIIAADTRISWFNGLFHKDQDHKIALCEFGLITGSGYVDALDSVKKELLKKTISHTDEIYEIVNQYARPLIEQLEKDYPNSQHNTCFLITYATLVENKKTLRLAILHPEWNYKLGFYEKSAVVMPSGSLEESIRKYSTFLDERLVDFPKDVDDDKFTEAFFENFFTNIHPIAQCFHEISQISKFVSNDIDYAVTLLNGTVIYGYGKSEELMNGKNLRFSIIPASPNTKFLTPEIFKEGKKIEIPPSTSLNP